MIWWGTAALAVALLQGDDLVAARIRVRLETTAVSFGFYVRRSFRPAWSNEHGPNRLADELVEAIGRADLDGLDPATYHIAQIRTALSGVRDDAATGRSSDPDRLAELDLLLSDAFLLYGSHLLAGRVDPETLQPQWRANPRAADLPTVLEDALASRKIARALQRLAPTQEGYRRLRDALARERAIAASGGWPTLPEAETLERGDSSSVVATLRERLRREGDLESPGNDQHSDVFDEAVEQAVKHFQTRHGLDADGMVNAPTRAELNVSADDRVEQLRLNLERWRWLPQDLGRRRILVNIAAYELQVVEDEEVVLSMRVVVGRRYKRTPIFSDTVRYIVLNPYWHVPRSIAVEDLLPKIQHDPSYLERFGMQLVDTVSRDPQAIDPDSVDWSGVTADNFHYRINQEPGRLNALGRIKFVFPNRYDIYLHDTPSHELFEQAQRDFSHGCIRVEKPLDLAAYLMKRGSRWNREAMVRALDEGTERTIYLPRPLPIHLLYWTAWADEDGTIQFRPDINKADYPLALALEGKRKN